MAVLEDLSEDEAYLATLLMDHSGLDHAEFLWFEPDDPDGCFRAWPYQWSWWRSDQPLQVDQCARSVGKSLSIKVRGFAFPFLFPNQEMVITAPEKNHLQPIGDLIENQLMATRLSREMLNRRGASNGIKHQPLVIDFANGARIMGRIPQRDGKGVKGCVAEGTLVLAAQGYVPVETLKPGDLILTHGGRWEPLAHLDEDENDCFEVTGQGAFPLTVSCDHRFLGRANLAGGKAARCLDEASWFDVEDLVEQHVYWTSPGHFDSLPVPQPSFVGTARPFSMESPHFWSIVGRYLADGYLSDRHGAEQRVHFVVVPERKGEVTAALDAIGLHSRFVERDHSSAGVVEVASAPLRRWLLEHFGEHANGKRLASFTLGLPEDHRRALLNGYLQGDGHWSEERSRWQVGSASKALVLGVLMLAQSLGLRVNCSFVDPKVSSIRGTKLRMRPQRSWRLQISERGHAVEAKDGSFSAKVKSVVPVGKRRVFNPIVLGDEGHSYVSESIVSHNIHPIWLELDEAQDYPHAAWMELVETLKRGHEGAVWRAHGVTRGVQDDFFKFTQEGSDWRVHRFTAMSRPNWTDEERQEKINTYGSKDHPDYRRNVYGSHGDAGNPLFVLSRLMRCVDDDQVSDFNLDTYYYKRLNDEMLRDLKMEAAQAIDFPSTHFNDDFKAYWIGCDFGWTRDPSEFLVWAEEKGAEGRKSRLRLITRIHMDRITAPQQTRVLLALLEAYHPKACAMDSTGAGLPVFQQLQELVEVMPGYRWALDVIKGYNFSSKIVVDIDQTVEVDEFFGDPAKDAGIERNVLEYSTDKLREYVDQERLLLPWDTDLIGEYTGQTYVRIAGMDAYGRRKFSGGKDHCLDASRLAILGHAQLTIEALLKPRVTESVFDILG